MEVPPLLRLPLKGGVIGEVKPSARNCASPLKGGVIGGYKPGTSFT